MHPVSEVLLSVFRCAAGAFQSAVPMLRKSNAALFNVLQILSAATCAAKKDQSTQWDEYNHSRTALLFLKINECMYMCICTYAYRGNIGSTFKVLPQPLPGGVGVKPHSRSEREGAGALMVFA